MAKKSKKSGKSKKSLSVDVKSMRKLSTKELARAVGGTYGRPGQYTQTGSCWSTSSCCNSC